MLFGGSELGASTMVTGSALGLNVRRNSVGLPPTKSPLREAGMYVLSPRDVINSGNRQNQESTLSGYQAPSTKWDEHNNAPYMIKGKATDMRNIEKEAFRKAKIPSPSHYKMKPVNPWDGKDTKNKNEDSNLFARAVRNTPADLAVLTAQRKELSTPGPSAYKPNYRLVSPRERGGYSGMSPEKPKTEKKILKPKKELREMGEVPLGGCQDDAIAKAQEIPGVGQYNQVKKGYKGFWEKRPKSKWQERKYPMFDAETKRLDKVRRNSSPFQHGDTNEQYRYAYDKGNFQFSAPKAKRVSIAAQAALSKLKLPSVGQYNVDRGYAALSKSPSSISRRR